MEINYSPFIVEKYNETFINLLYYRVGLDYYFSFPLRAQVGIGSNGAYLGLSFITNNNKLFKINNDNEKRNKSSRIKIGGKNLSEVNLFDLREMIQIFLEDCRANGIYIRENNIQANTENLSSGLVASAYAMNNDDEIILKVDANRWKNSSPLKKWFILYHELGHDVLNLEHGEGGPIMFNYVDKDFDFDREYSWDDWIKAKNYMFLSYKKYN